MTLVASSETGVSQCDRHHPEFIRGGDRMFKKIKRN